MRDPTPWPVARDARSAWVVGGTFDPPHEGHVGLTVAARDRVEPSAWLVFVPAARSPFKSGEGQTEPAQRVEMLRRALQGREHCAIWTDEVDRAIDHPSAPSYTIDTVLRARAVAPGVRLSLVIGADQAALFHKWKDAREILSLCTLRVLGRGEFAEWSALERALCAARFWTKPEIDAWRDALIEGLPVHEASAMKVREIVRHSGVESVPKGWLSAGVTEYIRARGLYRSK